MIITRAKWVRATENFDAPVFVKRISLPEPPVSAKIEICGLGYFELTVNGSPVTDHRLIPNPSIYERRPLDRLLYPIKDEFTFRTYYHEFDIAQLLREGENVIEAACGNGWYNQRERVIEGDVSYGERSKLRFAADIELRDGGHVAADTDGSEKWYKGEILYSNLFIGEVIDSRKSGLRELRPVEPAPDAETNFTLSDGADDKVIREITPKLLGIIGGRYIYDAGETVSGLVRLSLSEPAGTRVTLRFAEALNDGGALDFTTTGSSYRCGGGEPQIQQDVFVTSGEQYDFEPKFVYHAFRYFDVEGTGAYPTVVVIHSDTPVTSEFHCEDATLNWLYSAFVRTQLANSHGSYPSDCPHRERLGYTGDGQITARAAMLTLDTRAFYRKWIRDIADCQDSLTGHVQHTAPFMGGGGAPGAWGGAMVFVPRAYYEVYGDRSVLEIYYPNMAAYIDYMLTRCEGDIVVREENNDSMSFLGDWLAVGGMFIPSDFINTYCFIKALDIVGETERIIGVGDGIRFDKAAGRSRAALKAKYFDIATGSYFGGVQGADAFAVDLGIGYERTPENLARHYNELGAIDTGMIGTPVLLDTLFSQGYGELAVRLITAPTDHSYHCMMAHGATTLWENWNFTADSSRCHPILGAPVEYLFKYLLGIRPLEPGYGKVAVNPCVLPSLGEVSGKITTTHGEIAVKITPRGSSVEIAVTITGDVGGYIEYSGNQAVLSPGETVLCVRK